MALSDLIKSKKQYPVRRCYIKRRLFDGTYEASWFRVDYLQGKNRVIDWGSFSLELDFQPGEIGNFELSALQLVFDNEEGSFNSEIDPQSIFYPEYTYINRRYAKVKVECGYLDEDGAEVGVDSIFEGVIERVVVSEDQTAVVTVLPYIAILNSYLIVDLALTGSGTVSSVVTSIMNQSKITEFIPYVAPTNSLDPTITDLSLLEGSYWDILKLLAQQSDSVPILDGTAFSFQDRSAGALAWNFQGAGTQFPDMDSLTAYDDEGADKVRLYWQAKGSSVTAITTDSSLLIKYLNSPQRIDLSAYDDSNKQTILNALLTRWSKPRPTISLLTNFMVNEIPLLGKITVKIAGPVFPLNTGRWGFGTWGDGSVWGKSKGSVNINSGIEWIVLRIVKNINDWNFEIHSEKVV